MENITEYPPTLVINLDERPERWERIQHDFQDWVTPVERVSAIRHSPGWKGCSASHLHCVRIAKERNYPWVIIIEDDCKPMENAKQRFVDLLPLLWSRRDDWDMFFGGSSRILHHSIVSLEHNIYQFYGYSAHFYLVHRDAYDRILTQHPTELDMFNDPIDVYYPKHFRLWITSPFLARQYPGESDIQHEFVDYSRHYNMSEQLLNDS